MPFTIPTTVASKANTGYGAQFSIGSVASPLSYTAVSECKSIKNNGNTVNVIETSHLLSPLNTEEMIPGMIKPGTIDVSGNFIGDTSQLSFNLIAQAQSIIAWKYTAPCNNRTQTYTCVGTGFVVKSANGPLSNTEANGYDLSLQITGPYTETVA
jgi:hypothetical protein